MKFITTVCAVLITTGLSISGSQASELLLNGGFETPSGSTLTGGNNIGTVPTGWVLGAGYTASNSNLQNGTSTSGTNALLPYSGPYSGDSSTVSGTAGGGTNCWDGTGTANHAPVTLTQTFVLNAASNIVGTFASGGRDPGSETVSTTVSFTGSAYTSPNEVGTTTDSTWTVSTFSLSNVPAGTYTFSIVLPDFLNIDAVSLVSTPVPEASTWVFMTIGFVLLGVVRRFRCSAPV